MNELGLSGDDIQITEEFIIKICKTDQKRFQKNIQKQLNFNNPYIDAVPITQKGWINNEFYIQMPHLHCENAMVWLSKADVEEINEFIKIIMYYFKFIIKNSNIKYFDIISWNDKLSELKEKINDTFILEVIKKLYLINLDGYMYYGESHNDFTLTNLIISRDKKLEINAIDFLHTFINSPINDIVKFRQDTKHHWTLNLISYINFDMNKSIIILNYIDNIFVDLINNDPILKKYYLPFQILNLVRLIPYCKEYKLLNYVKNEIRKLI